MLTVEEKEMCDQRAQELENDLNYQMIVGDIKETVANIRVTQEERIRESNRNHEKADGTGGQRIFGNTDGKGEIIGAMNVKDSDEVICMTSQGKTLRFKASEIREQGQGASGVRIVTIKEPDYLVGIDKVQDKE